MTGAWRRCWIMVCFAFFRDDFVAAEWERVCPAGSWLPASLCFASAPTDYSIAFFLPFPLSSSSSLQWLHEEEEVVVVCAKTKT